MENDITETKEFKTNSDKLMYCLWNGEYGYHDLSHINGLSHVLYNQNNIYSRYIGIEIGDFLCIGVEYDFGIRDQRWKVTCKLCGEETYRYHTGDWRRGKGGSTKCHCRKDREKQEIANRKESREKEIKEEIGKHYGKFVVIEYKGYDACKVKCTECGAIRRTGVSISKLKNGIFPNCDCNKPHYNDPKWIGKRVGHLTVERCEGHYFICRCDCGREKVCNTTFFANEQYRDCGNPECKFIEESKARILAAKMRGDTYEFIAKALLENNGYKVKSVGKTGDFGVDLIATDNSGMKIAVQCKSNMKQTIGVEAVQQVYAGGRYYGLEHFAVIGHSGYSVNAVKMAKKLGVYLSNGMEFIYPDDIKKYVNELIPTYDYVKNTKAQKLYELNGVKKTLENWAFEYGTSSCTVRNGLKRGLTFENALKYNPRPRSNEKYTLNGVTGTIRELYDYYNPSIRIETIRYRMKIGQSIEEAFFCESRMERIRNKNP